MYSLLKPGDFDYLNLDCQVSCKCPGPYFCPRCPLLNSPCRAKSHQTKLPPHQCNHTTGRWKRGGYRAATLSQPTASQILPLAPHCPFIHPAPFPHYKVPDHSFPFQLRSFLAVPLKHHTPDPWNYFPVLGALVLAHCWTSSGLVMSTLHCTAQADASSFEMTFSFILIFIASMLSK